MTDPGLVKRIADLIEHAGPQTGAHIRAVMGRERRIDQWRACMQSPLLITRRVGRRYLRLDENVPGYARLSPSILREFLTYTVVGLASRPGDVVDRAEELASRVREISAAKSRLAERLIGDVIEKLPPDHLEGDLFAVLLAGDIVYEMGHDAPRPERSTGRMVRGSDLDLVVLLDDSAPSELAERLDEEIYRQKHRQLINPSVREEIDYTIKTLSKMREQTAFHTFKEMVSCKILDEAVLLHGSERIFAQAKSMLAAQNIPARLAAMEQRAAFQRQAAEKRLLAADGETPDAADMRLFCGTEEHEEFE
jgi:hypothetical protein